MGCKIENNNDSKYLKEIYGVNMDQITYVFKNKINNAFDEDYLKEKAINYETIIISYDNARLFMDKVNNDRINFIRENGKEPKRIILGPMQMLKLRAYIEIAEKNGYTYSVERNINKLFGMEIIQMNLDGIAFDIGNDFMKFINTKQKVK